MFPPPRWGCQLSERPNLDQELVALVQTGDKRAFDQLVLKYQVRIANLVSRYVYDPAEVEDVVQEVFIKAYRAIGRFRGDSAFYTWIYRIAVNTAKNHLVSQSRRPPGRDVEASEVVNSEVGRDLHETATPEAHFMSDELADCVNGALDNLPADLREAITLREIEGLSYEEIATAMSCPIGTVRSRIFRARDAIDKELQKLAGEGE